MRGWWFLPLLLVATECTSNDYSLGHNTGGGGASGGGDSGSAGQPSGGSASGGRLAADGGSVFAGAGGARDSAAGTNSGAGTPTVEGGASSDAGRPTVEGGTSAGSPGQGGDGISRGGMETGGSATNGAGGSAGQIMVLPCEGEVIRTCLDVLPLITIIGVGGGDSGSDSGGSGGDASAQREPVQTGPGSIFPHPSAVAFTNSVLNAVNSSGQIAGAKLCSNGQTRAVLFEEGVPRDLTEALGAEYSEAKGINHHGVVIGEYAYRISGGNTGPHFGFIWKDGVLTTLAELGAVSMVAINDQGQVLIAKSLEPGPNDPDCRAEGNDWAADGRVGPCGVRGLLWRDGIVTDLGTLGGASTLPIGLDDQGVVTGISQRAGAQAPRDGFHPFVWQNGEMWESGERPTPSPPVQVPPPVFDGAGTSEVSWFSGDVGASRPVVFKDDQTVPLWGVVEGKKFLDGEVRDMNDSGLIVGIGRTVRIGWFKFNRFPEAILEIVSSQAVAWSPDCYLGCCSEVPAGAGGTGAGSGGAGSGGAGGN